MKLLRLDGGQKLAGMSFSDLYRLFRLVLVSHCDHTVAFWQTSGSWFFTCSAVSSLSRLKFIIP